jgi:putative GTP pyrophosphokinase
MDEVDWDSIRQQYDEKIPIFIRLKDEALFIINQALNETDIKIYSIPARVKDANSFISKSKRKDYKNPLMDVKDIVGLRIVCLFLSDINRISDIVRSSFDVISSDNKIGGSDATLFGYLSVHFIAKLKDECSGPRYSSLKDRHFEIQVRTLTMDAWANISHYLDYKSDVDIPSDLKRDFYALSGLFYVADMHFELFYNTREKATQLLEKYELEPSVEINFDSLKAYLGKRFPDRDHAETNEYSELVEELIKNGYTSIGKLEKALEASTEAFLAYENETKGKKFFKDVGFVRVSLDLFDKKFRGTRNGDENIERFEYLIRS